MSTHTPYLGFYQCLHIQHIVLINSPSPPINLKKKSTQYEVRPFKCHHKTLCQSTNQKWPFSSVNSFRDQWTLGKFTILCHLSDVLHLKYCLEVIIILPLQRLWWLGHKVERRCPLDIVTFVWSLKLRKKEVWLERKWTR
jgi:hypothetical protein